MTSWLSAPLFADVLLDHGFRTPFVPPSPYNCPSRSHSESLPSPAYLLNTGAPQVTFDTLPFFCTCFLNNSIHSNSLRSQIRAKAEVLELSLFTAPLASRAKRNARLLHCWTSSNNLSIHALTTYYLFLKSTFQLRKKKKSVFSCLNKPPVFTYGTRAPVGHLTISQTLELDWIPPRACPTTH